MSELLLERILAPGSLSVRFQPVLEVKATERRPHYFEALIRGPQGTSAESPEVLFEYARKKNRESAVDRACVLAILEAAAALGPEGKLGINVHASTLAMDEDFVEFLAASLEAKGFSPRRLVIEIVEHAPPWDVSGFLRTLQGLRGLGARIALDDVGLGHSNYKMILQCRPDYLKVDRYFVSGCARDFHRRAVLSSVAQLARPFGSQVVAEGVEEADDLQALRRMGLTLMQGHLFGEAVPASEVSLAADVAPLVSVTRPAPGDGHGRTPRDPGRAS